MREIKRSNSLLISSHYLLFSAILRFLLDISQKEILYLVC